MEVQKRKSSDKGVKKRIKMANDDGKSKETKVEDDEVEEFYAIIRRIRVAVKYFEKGNAESACAREKLTAETPWKQVFRQEDKVAERVEENVGLDLNAEPVTDPNLEAD